MARYATGKKSVAISDRSGFKVKYNELRTTWDGLRVEYEEWEPKHPQLTPAKNVFDATALFNPRPDGDPENVTFFVGFNYDIFLDQRSRPSVGVNANGGVGSVVPEIEFTETGVAGTGAVGTEAIELSIDEAGVAGTGAVGSISPTAVKGVSGLGGAGGVGVEALSLSIDEAGVAGTGAVGAEAVELSINEAGVAGTGAVGNESAVVDESFWGSGSWGSGTWGN
jgi:hypothetical protein